MPPTVRDGLIEWDAAKDRVNQRKHRVSFAEAAVALAQRQTAVFTTAAEQAG